MSLFASIGGESSFPVTLLPYDLSEYSGALYKSFSPEMDSYATGKNVVEQLIREFMDEIVQVDCCVYSKLDWYENYDNNNDNNEQQYQIIYIPPLDFKILQIIVLETYTAPIVSLSSEMCIISSLSPFHILIHIV